LLESGVEPQKTPDGVYISTYGCQMNINDSERMYTLLEMLNYTPVETPEEAALIIINSCSVREKPVHKVHSEVGRYRKLKARHPYLKIGVSGCVAQQEKEKLIKDMPLIDFVIGTDAIDQLPDVISRLGHEKPVSAKFEHSKPYQIQTMIRNPGVATFVNITKGCDNFCTFCVVPFTRGRERSRSMKEVISDIKNLVKRGVKEVTLVGQNVNSYTSDCGTTFTDLLRIVAEDTDIERIRYTTSHPKDYNQDLVNLHQKYRSKICDYVHLPAQSGNSEILERMNRGYTREEYLDKVRMISEAIPGVTLSTDLIVGFPGETEAQFEDTLSLTTLVPYDNIYAFAYSARPFTKAAKFEEQMSEAAKKERLQRLIQHHKEISFPKAKNYEGQTMAVLVEEVDELTGIATGRSTQNKVVHFKGSKDLIAQTVPVKITSAFPQTLKGEMVQ
jgi:tRNA-2-methylthio-N6-dimethylallyladenosine synthase